MKLIESLQAGAFPVQDALVIGVRQSLSAIKLILQSIDHVVES